MTWLALLLGALWLAVAVFDLLAVMRLPELPALEPGAPEPGAPEPEVAVVVAVRDDGDHVADAVARLLAQRGVRLSLTVVDDRSTDGTADVLARLAASEPRLRVITVRELPPDWLGKSHALHVGAAGVTAPWLLFTDTDARLGSHTLARAIAAAERAAAQHVFLLPTNRDTTLAGRSCLLAFQLAAQLRIAAVNGTPQRSFAGIGAFNLVRTDAYRGVGGHLPLRLEVIDDVWLGGLLRRAGHRSRAWFAPRELSIDWGGTPARLLRVLEKNMFAALRYRTVAAAGAAIGMLAVLGATACAPCWAGPIGWFPLGAYLATGAAGVLLAARLQWSVLAGALAPLARVVLPVALLRSMLVTLRQGGVRWRGTFYPLALLRAGQVRL